MPKQPPGDDNVGRMQFLLALRRRGISDPAVLRAMDEVPREHFVESRFRRRRLCRPGTADRLRPDHQPALCRRLHDRAARRAAGPSRARSGHRLGLPGRRAVAARARGGQRRALPHAGGHRAQPAGRRSATTMSRCGSATVWPASRSGRHTTASSSLRRPRAIPEALIAQLADGGVMVLPLGPHAGPQQLVKLTKGGAGDRAGGPDRGAFCAAVAGKGSRIVTISVRVTVRLKSS